MCRRRVHSGGYIPGAAWHIPNGPSGGVSPSGRSTCVAEITATLSIYPSKSVGADLESDGPARSMPRRADKAAHTGSFRALGKDVADSTRHQPSTALAVRPRRSAIAFTSVVG